MIAKLKDLAKSTALIFIAFWVPMGAIIEIAIKR